MTDDEIKAHRFARQQAADAMQIRESPENVYGCDDGRRMAEDRPSLIDPSVTDEELRAVARAYSDGGVTTSEIGMNGERRVETQSMNIGTHPLFDTDRPEAAQLRAMAIEHSMRHGGPAGPVADLLARAYSMQLLSVTPATAEVTAVEVTVRDMAGDGSGPWRLMVNGFGVAQWPRTPGYSDLAYASESARVLREALARRRNDAPGFSPSTACADAMRAADRWRREYDVLHVAYCKLVGEWELAEQNFTDARKIRERLETELAALRRPEARPDLLGTALGTIENFKPLVEAALAVHHDARDQGRDDCMDDLVDEQHIERLRHALELIGDYPDPGGKGTIATALRRERAQPCLIPVDEGPTFAERMAKMGHEVGSDERCIKCGHNHRNMPVTQCIDRRPKSEPNARHDPKGPWLIRKQADDRNGLHFLCAIGETPWWSQSGKAMRFPEFSDAFYTGGHLDEPVLVVEEGSALSVSDGSKEKA